MKHSISKIISYLLIGFSLISCTNEKIADVIYDVKNTKTQDSLNKTDFTNILCNIELDTTFMREMHNLVQLSLSDGRDEIVLFSKLLEDETFDKVCNKSIVQKLVKFNENNVTRGAINNNSAENLLGELQKDKIIIYWPYSEMWDGKELPVIVCAPDDEDVEVCDGFKLSTNPNGSININKISVDEEYAKNHPVWIVKEYKNDDNITYLKPITDFTPDIKNFHITRSAYNVNVWTLTKMKVTHQYDSWIAGGSEFDIQIVYPSMPGYAATSSKFRVEFSRSDISNGKEKNLSLILNTNWRENQITNGILISEADGGDDVNIPISYSYKDSSGFTITASYTLKIQSHDEFIGQTSLDRDYILKYGTYSFCNNVFLTMPIIPQ